jgi:NRPS condensation-like uncharacterized protein
MKKLKILTERAYLRSPSIHVGIKAEIKGVFSDDEFNNALEIICKRHPLLLSTITIETDSNAYYLLNNRKKIEVEFSQYAEKDQWLKWYEMTDNKPFDLESGPLLKMCVIRNHENSTIVILGHHLLGDGLAYMFLFRDLVKALSGELDSLELIPPVMKVESIFPSKAKLGIISRAFANKLNRTWKKNARKFTKEDFHEFFYDYRSKNKAALYINSLDKEVTEKLISKCHENKLTVNEALITAFLSSIQKVDERHIGKTDEVGVAINVRNELTPNPGESMGNFVSGILVKLKYDYCKSFWENAKIIGIKLKKKLNDTKSRFIVLNLLAALDPELIDSICFAKYGNYDNVVSIKLADIIGERTVDKGIGVTNLGRFDMKLNNSRFEINEVVFIQPAFPANDINIGVLTLNNRMTFCLRYLKSDKSYELVDKIFCDAISLLAES